VVLNNHFRGQAPANAFELEAILTGGRPAAPRPLRLAHPAIAEFTTPEAPPPGEAPDLFDR
jgi:hypothetical protein